MLVNPSRMRHKNTNCTPATSSSVDADVLPDVNMIAKGGKPTEVRNATADEEEKFDSENTLFASSAIQGKNPETVASRPVVAILIGRDDDCYSKLEVCARDGYHCQQNQLSRTTYHRPGLSRSDTGVGVPISSLLVTGQALPEVAIKANESSSLCQLTGHHTIRKNNHTNKRNKKNNKSRGNKKRFKAQMKNGDASVQHLDDDPCRGQDDGASGRDTLRLTRAPPSSPDVRNTTTPPNRVQGLDPITVATTTTTKTVVMVYLALCIFRLLNTFLVRSYFDPDEFWQTLEPAYCSVFTTGGTDDQRHHPSPCQGLTWEWKRRASDIMPTTATAIGLLEQSLHGPVRSYLSVLPTHALYWLLKRMGADTHWLVSRGPMLLQAVTVAAPIDTAIWYAGRNLVHSGGIDNIGNAAAAARWCLFGSLTSWFNAYTLVRTISNGQEALFVILAVALMSPELSGTTVLSTRANYLRSSVAFLLGGLGVAIRFTSIAAFVPMGILLALREPRIRTSALYLLLPCTVFGLTGIFIASVVDRVYFGFWTIPFLGSFHFNAIQKLADLYGTHPAHWYLTSGLPTVAGLLLPFALYSFWLFATGASTCPGQRNLWIITISYVAAVSLSSHKEFRFILPVLPLICLLTASHVQRFIGGGSRSRKLFLGSIWIIANLVALLYLGMFHQSGPVSVNHEIAYLAASNFPAKPTSPIVVHYLTGSCHSTPLLSHLHSPPLRFDTWHLDCSPSCRADVGATCESDNFALDPVGFVDRAYEPCKNVTFFWRKKHCLAKAQARPVPDYLVTYSEYVPLVQDQLKSLGMDVVARFPHSIAGAAFGTSIFGPDADYLQMLCLSKKINIRIEEVVLFARISLRMRRVSVEQ
jgi:GPI mannosyltransferase 3